MSDKIAKKQYGTAQNALGTTVTVNDVTYNIIGIYKAQGQYTSDGNQNPYGADLLAQIRYIIMVKELLGEIL